MTIATSGRLVALVVTHNRLDHLRLTLGRLLETPRHALEAVIVVDNASTDGTREWLSTQDDARLITQRSKRNIGGAGGFEWGLRYACRNIAFDWIVLMDDDGRPAADGLQTFHQQDHSGWDAVAAAVYSPSGTICEMNRPVMNPFRSWHRVLKTLFGGGRASFHLSTEDYHGRVQRVDLSSFVGLFLRRETILRTGFPDPSLFIYGEDALYTLAISRAGGRIGFMPAIRFEHDCSTFAAGAARLDPLWKLSQSSAARSSGGRLAVLADAADRAAQMAGKNRPAFRRTAPVPAPAVAGDPRRAVAPHRNRPSGFAGG